MQSSLIRRNGVWIPSKTRNQITALSNVVTVGGTAQAGLYAREWLGGLMTGIWSGGNTWLALEVGTGVNGAQNPVSTLQNPVLRKLIDYIEFVQSDGVTVSNGPTTTILLSASLQTPDANGYTISEYAIFGGGLNLNQASFGTGLCIIYQTPTPISKVSSQVVQFSIVINV